MLICRNQKVVFIAVPKTGTRSIYRVLQDHYGGKRIQDHLQVVPGQYRSFFTFIVARNPYDRVCSIYWAMCQRAPELDQYNWKNSLRKKGLENNLENFLLLVKSGVKQRVDHPIHQYRFHNRNDINSILRFESLQNDFNNLPFIKKPVELPRINITVDIKSVPGKIRMPRPPWKEMINERSIRLINEIYAKDFDLLGYEMIK